MAEPFKGELARDAAEGIGASIGASGSQQYHIKAAPEGKLVSSAVNQRGS